MRIDNYANILASAKTNVADFMSRLEPGDVIRAKVLEITSDEVVLKLFDGSVIRAGMLEALNAKAGDTVMLAVSSKHEGTIYLESVRNTSQITESNPVTLKQLLESIKIKPDTQNLELAAEFIKAGAPVTVENMEKAAALLNSKPVLDSEKAVFITLKGLNADSADTEMLSKLLDGELKLGYQLKEVQIMLEQANQAGGNKVYTEPANTAMAEKSDAAGVNQSNATGTKQAIFTSENQANPAQTSLSPNNAPQADEVHQNYTTGANQTNEAQTKTVQTDASQIQNAVIKNDKVAIQTSDNSIVNAEQTFVQISDAQNLADGDLQPSAGVIAELRENADSGMTPEKAESGTEIKTAKQSENETADRFAKLIEAVRDLFVKTDSEKLSSELDARKINNELNEKLELLKAAIKSSEKLDSGAKESLSAAAAQIEDTQRLLQQMNAGNILYYQIPVNLTGHNTTAELYVMNRRKEKKKIDPNNTVMFISLDTVNMGRVETLLDIKNSNITVNLRTESKQINDFIKTQIKDLYTGLASIGYKLAGVRYAIIGAPTTPIQQERLLNGIASENYGKVDYRI